ncbi:putative glucosinolate gamma-glutamyl hydrolase [Paratrimastix pyriformis]|uniref:Glucosinolate gamma-glutamyl hydrolase n=1 Tax=Paratrimastix pyriformis TaxID=342808 RepID=A0ABQ8UU09_9EUKA|nr:putative glucosinolate gamma-glutamyl hydrolase [Paratrimastix pyriformis]
MSSSSPPRKFGAIWCDSTQRWPGYVESLYNQFLNPDDQLVIFKAIDGELPPLDSLSEYAGFFISGSRFSVCDATHPQWMLNLRDFVYTVYRDFASPTAVVPSPFPESKTANPMVFGFTPRTTEKVDAMLAASDCTGRPPQADEAALPPTFSPPSSKTMAPPRRPKLMGFCFGHQLIAWALGGVVGHNPDGLFHFGVQTVNLTPAFFELPYIQGMPEAEPFRHKPLLALKSHMDCVQAPPSSAHCLARSSDTQYEGLAYGTAILTTQFHPEFNPDLILQKIYPRLVQGHVLGPEQAAAAIASLARGGAGYDPALLTPETWTKPTTPTLRPKEPLYTESEAMLRRMVNVFVHSG